MAMTLEEREERAKDLATLARKSGTRAPSYGHLPYVWPKDRIYILVDPNTGAGHNVFLTRKEAEAERRRSNQRDGMNYYVMGPFVRRTTSPRDK